MHIYVHRLVARAFPEICGEWFEGAQVNHKDENPANNAAWNLEWCTPYYNVNYGNRNHKVSEKLKNRKDTSKPVIQLTNDYKFVKKWQSASEARKDGFTNIFRSIRDGCLCGGYKWVYESEYV